MQSPVYPTLSSFYTSKSNSPAAIGFGNALDLPSSGCLINFYDFFV